MPVSSSFERSLPILSSYPLSVQISHPFVESEIVQVDIISVFFLNHTDVGGFVDVAFDLNCR